MKKSTRRRLELEPLESLQLLSGILPVARHPGVVVGGPIQLQVSSRLQGHAPAAGTIGLTSVGSAGQLAGIGRTTSVLQGNAAAPGRSLTLGGRPGNLAPASQIALPARGATAAAPYGTIEGDGLASDNLTPTGTPSTLRLAQLVVRPSDPIKLP